MVDTNSSARRQPIAKRLSLSVSYASLPADLRHGIVDAMRSGKLSKSDYSSLVRQSLDDGVVLSWPAENKTDLAGERAKLMALVKADTS